MGFSACYVCSAAAAMAPARVSLKMNRSFHSVPKACNSLLSAQSSIQHFCGQGSAASACVHCVWLMIRGNLNCSCVLCSSAAEHKAPAAQTAAELQAAEQMLAPAPAPSLEAVLAPAIAPAADALAPTVSSLVANAEAPASSTPALPHLNGTAGLAAHEPTSGLKHTPHVYVFVKACLSPYASAFA